MKTLKQYAQKAFLDYAYKKTGVWIDWNYLSGPRRLVWMKEIKQTFTDCLQFIKTDMKPPVQLVSGSTSYEKGFLAGQAFEGRRLEAKIESRIRELEAELDDYENRLKKS